MKKLSFLALLAAVVLTAATANAQAQTKPDPASVRLYTVMRSFVLEKAVVDELKLDEPQQTKLADLEKTATPYLTDVRTLSYLLPAKDSTTLRDQSQLVLAQEMLTILKEGQARRLKEITLQQAASGTSPFFGSILTLDPKLADELKLTDEQKTKLSQSGPGFGARQPLADVLTEEQKKKWADMVGKPIELNRGPGGGGRPGGNFLAFTLGTPLQYLDDAAVQKDLDLAEAQKKKLVELDKKRTDAVAKLAGLSEEDQGKLADDTRTQLTKDVEELLTPDQRKRLTQLRFQFSVLQRRGGGGRFGGPAVVTLEPLYVLPTPVARLSLKLTEEQTTKIQKREEERVADIGKALLSDDKFADVEKKVAKLKESANADMLASLTDEQKTEFKELIGKPFAGPLPPPTGFGGRGGFGGGRGGFTRMAVVEGLYYAELLYLVNKDVQAELKLSDDQLKQVSAQEGKWRSALMHAATTLDAEKRSTALKSLSAVVEKQMGELLKAEQSKRLKQLALRARADLDGTNGLCSYPGVAAELKLTADQKAKAAVGGPGKVVFTEEQKKTLRDLRGEPASFILISGFGGGPGGGGFLSGPSDRFYLVQQEPVQKELKLTEAQLAKVQELEKKLNAQIRVEIEKADEKYPTEQIQALETASHKTLDGVLMPEQSKRLRQLELQLMMPYNFGEALQEKDVIEALKLTKDQQEKITAILEDANKRVTLLNREVVPRFGFGPGGGGPGGGGPGPGPMTPNVNAKLRERQETKLQEVLSAEQKEKWKELLGKPFEFGGRGGPGGVPG